MDKEDYREMKKSDIFIDPTKLRNSQVDKENWTILLKIDYMIKNKILLARKESSRVEYVRGWRAALKAVFEFLKVMEKVKDVEELEEDYMSWEKSDEYTKPNGEVVRKW